MIALGFHFRRERERAERERMRKLRKRQSSAYFPQRPISPTTGKPRPQLVRRGSFPTSGSKDAPVEDPSSISPEDVQVDHDILLENGNQSPKLLLACPEKDEIILRKHSCPAYVQQCTSPLPTIDNTSELMSHMQINGGVGGGDAGGEDGGVPPAAHLGVKKSRSKNNNSMSMSKPKSKFTFPASRKTSMPARFAGSDPKAVDVPFRSISDTATRLTATGVGEAPTAPKSAGVLERLSSSAKKKFSLSK